MLTEIEKELYNRQIIIPDFGEELQEKLKVARVLIVGAGGLGASVGIYLAAAGVGYIGIADSDIVSLSNLQRQILYNFHDLGKSKVLSASNKLAIQNPYIHIEQFGHYITPENAADIMHRYDIIVGAIDNAKARYLLNDTCVALGKVYIHGAISNFQGQVAVFNYKGGKSYRDIFPESPQAANVLNNEKGVLAPLPGVIGSIMVSEIIKVITSCGEVLSNKLLIIDLQSNVFQTINI